MKILEENNPIDYDDMEEMVSHRNNNLKDALHPINSVIRLDGRTCPICVVFGLPMSHNGGSKS